MECKILHFCAMPQIKFKFQAIQSRIYSSNYTWPNYICTFRIQDMQHKTIIVHRLHAPSFFQSCHWQCPKRVLQKESQGKQSAVYKYVCSRQTYKLSDVYTCSTWTTWSTLDMYIWTRSMLCLGTALYPTYHMAGNMPGIKFGGLLHTTMHIKFGSFSTSWASATSCHVMHML